MLARSNHPVGLFPTGPVNNSQVVISVEPGARATSRILLLLGSFRTGAFCRGKATRAGQHLFSVFLKQVYRPRVFRVKLVHEIP
jgi:hypothetical protein